MSFSNVMALATGEASDAGVVSHAADIARAGRGKLLIVYVIRVSRSYDVDAELEDQISRGEQALRRAEQLAKLTRGALETQLLQAREVGPAVMHELRLREDVDAMVVGTSYKLKNGRYSLGEHVPYLLERCPTPVILYREQPKGHIAQSLRFRSSRNGAQAVMTGARRGLGR